MRCQQMLPRWAGFLTFTVFFIFGFKWHFPLLWPPVSFGERKFVFSLAAVSALWSALSLRVVKGFVGLLTTRLATQFGPHGVWTERHTTVTHLVQSVHSWLM